MSKFLAVFLITICCLGCKSDSAKKDLQLFLKEYEPTTQVFKISADSLINLRGEKGTVLKIDPSDLRYEGGTIVKGDLEVHLLELFSIEELLRANAQTVSNGKWLVSGGVFKIQIFSGNKKLKLAEGKSIEVDFPKITSEQMQLFDGSRDLNGNMNWELSKQVLKNRKYPVLIRRDSSFMRFNRQFAIDMRIDTIIYNSLIEEFSFDEVKEKHPKLDSLLIRNDTILGIHFQRIMSELTPNNVLSNNGVLYDVSTGKFLNTNPTIKLVNHLYTSISISKLGWINIDRFYPKISDRANLELMPDLEMDYAQWYAVDSANNTLINLYEDEKGIISFSAPVGKRFIIISFGVKGDLTYGYKKSILIEKDRKHQIKYRKAGKKQMEAYFKFD